MEKIIRKLFYKILINTLLIHWHTSWLSIPVFKSEPMKTFTLILISLALVVKTGHSQCTPSGDQTTYGTNNVWVGYVYQGKSFNTYKGYVNEGTAASPNFDESFGGNQATYNTNGCSIYTDTFSVRYKLTQAFSDGDYTFTVGGDDGYRLSLDGGSTWSVNKWNDQGYGTTTYTIHMNGTYNLVYEFYENFGANRVSFNVVKACTGSGNPATYGSNNQWVGYIYSGMNFNTYKGFVTEGSSLSPNFDENFGGDNVSYGTSDCPITTEQFSVRYRLQKNLAHGVYNITVAGDDGYRLSLDGGSSWVINKWNDQSYTSSSYSATLNGTYNMVLEYYENGGQNRISFNMSGGAILPLTLTQFSGQSLTTQSNFLEWKTIMEMKVNYFAVQRSADGSHFQTIGQVYSKMTDTTHTYDLDYTFTDQSPLPGTSYYRLQIVDKTGASNYSDVIHLANNEIQGLKIFPTVIKNTNFFVETDKPLRNAKLELYDLSGKKLSETNWETLNGRQSVQPGNNMLATGTYIARLSAHGETVLNQLLIIQSH